MTKGPDDRTGGNHADIFLRDTLPKRRANNLPVTDPRRYLSAYGEKGAAIAFECLGTARRNFQKAAASYRGMIAELEEMLGSIQEARAKMPVHAVREYDERLRKVHTAEANCRERLREIKSRLAICEAQIRDYTPNL